MKICIAQTKSKTGKVKENILHHIRLVERAIALDAELIVFPELSITNYEPTLAKEFSTTVENSVFNPFQELSDNNNIRIGVGMPVSSANGVNISMLIFLPNKKREVYSKQILHPDELPYFTGGNKQVILTINDKKIALGICYETLQREHFLNNNKHGANIYIASVAKSKAGIEKAYQYFPKLAKKFNTPILMSNCVGNCDNFTSAGNSAVWNNNGKLVEHLDSQNPGLFIYNTETQIVHTEQTTIVKAQTSDLNELFEIYRNAKSNLEAHKIYQWTDNYPTKSIIENDLQKGVLYILKNNKEIIGAINLSEDQEIEYELINWKYNPLKVLVIHRLVINTKHQSKGFALQLMHFAEEFAKKQNYTSIRLDVYSKHNRGVDFYKKQNYVIRGKVFFSEREYPFYCMEKEIETYYN